MMLNVKFTQMKKKEMGTTYQQKKKEKMTYDYIIYTSGISPNQSHYT